MRPIDYVAYALAFLIIGALCAWSVIWWTNCTFRYDEDKAAFCREKTL